MIPTVIHQIWFQGQDHLTDRYLHFQNTWQRHHPGWTYRLWDADSIAALLKKEYPRFLAMYDSYPLMIQKVDVAKYFIMPRCGGFYIDMDMECQKPLTPLLDNDLVFAELYLTRLDILVMSFNKVKRRPFINNGCMASAPQHAFWTHVRENLDRHRPEKWYHKKEYYVSSSTGPQFFTQMVQSYRFDQNDKVLIAPPTYFEPESAADAVESVFPDAYAIHHQDDSWLTPFSRRLKTIRYKYLRI